MCRSLQRFTFVVFSLVFTFATLCSTTNAEDKPRLKIVMASPQGFLDDLEYLVVDLAEEKKQWDDNIYPSLDIFLIGVERTAPLRFDILLSDAGPDEKSGYRYQPCIPVEAGRKGLKDFNDNNLDPIGITPKLKKRDYYELTGGVFEGWMRIVGEDRGNQVRYACIAAKDHEDDIPKDMPLPEESHKDILAKGYDLGFEVLNTADQTELRKKQADDFVPYLMKDVAKKPDETEVWFNFRKTSQLHKYQQLHRMYVEAKQGTIGWTTDVAKKQGIAEFVLKALPETGLFDFIQTMGAEPSRFAAIRMAEDPVLGLRLNLPFDDFRRVQLDEWYPAALAAAKDKIDGSDEFAEEEREPAKQATDLLFDMLAAGDPLGRLDMFLDITRAESGKLGIVGGVRARDGKAADEIVKLIPKLHQEWSVVMDSEMIGDTAIHTLDVTKDTPKAIFDYFGDSGIVYVGTSAELVWIAGGEGAYEALKANIEQVSSGDSEVDATPEKFVDLKLQAGPLVSFADDLADETDWNLMGVVDIKPPGSAIGASGDKEAKTLQPVDPNEIRKIVRRSLLVDSEDRITGVITRTDDYIGGKMTFAPGVLRAAGKVVAKIVSDNLQ